MCVVKSALKESNVVLMSKVIVLFDTHPESNNWLCDYGLIYVIKDEKLFMAVDQRTSQMKSFERSMISLGETIFYVATGMSNPSQIVITSKIWE